MNRSRIMAGLALAATAANCVIGTLPSDAATTHAATTVAAGHVAPGPLNASKLTYVLQKWGVWVQVPKGWKMHTAKNSDLADFIDPSNTWHVKIDGYPAGQKDTATMALNEEHRLRTSHVSGLKIVSRLNGQVDYKPTPGDKLRKLTATTLIYTRGDKAHGTHWVTTRYVNLDGLRMEVTVGGRPQDAAGLTDVLNRATRTLQPTS